MNFWGRIREKIGNDLSLVSLLKLLMFFAIIWLIQETGAFWLMICRKVWSITKPFAYGFAFAYILRSPIKLLQEKFRVKRGIAIPFVYICFFIILLWLGFALVPMMIERSSALITSLINGMNWMYTQLSTIADSASSGWVKDLLAQVTGVLTNIQKILPDFSFQISDIFASLVSAAVTLVIALVSSIFMCYGWERMRFNIERFSRSYSKGLYECLFAINKEERGYIHSLLTLIAIHMIEYSIVYLLVGHQDWLIMGFLTGLALIIPYIGPTAANIIGVITAFTLPITNVIILVVLIVVLSLTDEYVMAPLVHSHNTSVTPLWAIFSVFACGSLLGTVGIVIAIPLYLAIKVIYHSWLSFEMREMKEENQ